MKMSTLCIIYVSEGLKLNIINQLSQKASSGGPLVHSFVDATYGRTSFFLMGDNLVNRSLELCKEAFKLISYDPLQGTHPALGVVDHISFSPMGPDATLSDASALALEFATKLHAMEKIPIYTYGDVSTDKLVLKNIRRDLGYFLKGEDLIKNMRHSTAVPAMGSMDLDFNEKKGIACVGAVYYLQNVNMRFRPTDDRKHVLQITKYIREPDVEALTLQHEGGSYEVACNLRRPRVVTPEMVIAKAERAIEELGLREFLKIAHSYTTGPTELELLSRLK